MIVKSFSPIQSGQTILDTSSDSYAGTQYFFTDSYPKLYCLVTRQLGGEYVNSGNTGNSYLLGYLRLNGYNNGTNYDYRIDLSNYIFYTNQDYSFTNVNDVVTFNVKYNFSNFNILFDNRDVMGLTGFTQYISSYADGIMYVTSVNLPNIINYCYSHLSILAADNIFDMAVDI
jgi:hypothetical protein